MTSFFWQKQNWCRTLPRSVIAQSLADLLETYPNGFFAQFALFVISDELLALLSLLHLDYSSPHRILNELCRRRLCPSSLDNSSLRAGLCHLWFHRDCYFFELYSNLSISAITEAVTWKSTRVFAMRYPTDMSTT